MDPTPTGLIDQLTAVLLLFFTTAVNCCFSSGYSVTNCGIKLTEGGMSVMVPVETKDGFEILVAVTVTVCEVGIDVGAAYTPEAVIMPASAGLMDQLATVPPQLTALGPVAKQTLKLCDWLL